MDAHQNFYLVYVSKIRENITVNKITAKNVFIKYFVKYLNLIIKQIFYTEYLSKPLIDNLLVFLK